MPRHCSVCSHQARAAIDEGLVAGRSLRDIAGQFALSKSALERHKDSHVPSDLARNGEDLDTRMQAAEQANTWRATQLIWNARAVMRAHQGWGRVQSDEAWRKVCEEARDQYLSGQFVIERLGAERYLDPQLMATLWRLRQGLIEAYGSDSPTVTMLIDLAVMTYYQALRTQGWMGDLALWIEHEFFAQDGPSVKVRRDSRVEGFAVGEQLRRLVDQLAPLFERANRQLIRNLKALEDVRHGPAPMVAIGRAGQVNVAQQQIHVHSRKRPPSTARLQTPPRLRGEAR